jgi:anti-sigma B factor antagonist
MTEARAVDAEPASVELLRWSVAECLQEVTVALEGELDLSTAGALTEVLEGVVARPTVVRVVVDLERVSFLDSSGIKSLLTAAHAASVVGCKFVARNPNPTVGRVFAICGVDKLLRDDSVGDISERR